MAKFDPRAAKRKTMASGVGAAMRAKADFSLSYLDLNDLTPHPANQFSMNERKIIELAENVQVYGLLEIPLVWIDPQGKTLILSGHRRTAAYKWLRDNVDADKYKQIPVRFLTGINEAESRVILHSANIFTRKLVNSERARSIAVLVEEAEQLRKDNPKYTGVRSAEIAAEILTTDEQSITSKTVYRWIKLDRELIPELKQLWDRHVLSQSQALELCQLGTHLQTKFYLAAKEWQMSLRKEEFESIRLSLVVGNQEQNLEEQTHKERQQLDIHTQANRNLKAIIKRAHKTRELIESGADYDKELIQELKDFLHSLEANS